MPLAVPPVVAVSEPDYLKDKASQGFQEFTQKPQNRAFAYSTDGTYGLSFNYETTQAARREALSQCRQYGDNCKIIAVNDRITVRNIYSGSPDPPDYLVGKAVNGFHKFVRKPHPRAFAYGKEGSYGYGYGYETVQEARRQALSRCHQHADDCRIIAVNNRITVKTLWDESTSTGKSSGTQTSWYPDQTTKIILLFLFAVVTFWGFRWYQNYMSSPEDRSNIRESSLEVDCSPSSALRTIERYVRKEDWLTKREVDHSQIVLESSPGFINNGYYFRINTEPTDSDTTRLDIECRHRLPFRLIHWFATSETNRLTDDLTAEFSDELIQSNGS